MLHGYCPPERYLAYLTWTEIAALPDKANTVIVLPAGSTEQLLNETGMVFGGDAATMGAGVITDQRMKVTYDMMVAMKLLDASKVDVKKTYTTQFVKDIKVLP